MKRNILYEGKDPMSVKENSNSDWVLIGEKRN